ncbi:MAG: hypothetical protein ACPLTR_12405 [Thermacetogeniaceae bacterium]
MIQGERNAYGYRKLTVALSGATLARSSTRRGFIDFAGSCRYRGHSEKSNPNIPDG